MKDIQSILALARESGGDLALATVVKTRGSAYRRPGARMLVTSDGRTAGMISGGCLEGDVKERALKVMQTGRPSLVIYDSSASYDIVFGLGLGCNGIVQVLIEKVSLADPEGVLGLFAQCADQRRLGSLATVFDGRHDAGPCMGAHLLHWPDGRLTSTSEDLWLRARLETAMAEVEGTRTAVRPLSLADGRHLGALIENFSPAPSLFVFGAGDDAIPLVLLAQGLGWQVTVIDARPDYAKSERFPAGSQVLCLRPEATPDLPAGAMVMVMTHSFERDKLLLRTLIPQQPRYLGILGPKARTERLLSDLAGESVEFSEAELARLHGPAGLDLGAETPEEIALSIIAEMQATIARRPATPLRHKTRGIHEEPSSPAPQIAASL